MGVTDLFATAWQIAVETASYLFAYLFVPVLAPALHLALLALAPARRWWPGARLGGWRAAVAAASRPLSRRSIETGLRSTDGAPAAVVYLASSHALTAYYWVLLGPLLGKDFLLSHVTGVVLFVLFAAPLARGLAVGTPVAPPAERPEDETSLPGLLGSAALRYVLLAALGLALGSLIAAWGFSPWAWAPAEVGGGGLGTQIGSGVLGLALASTGVPTVANLFVGTYLWKVGLAHAGIVTFFCAAPAAPTRWRLYARVFGRAGAARLVAALLVGALLAGLVTAWLFGAMEVTIRYKLVPEQLWEVR